MSMGRLSLVLVAGCAAAMSAVTPGWGAGFDKARYSAIEAMHPFGDRPKVPEISPETAAALAAKAAPPEAPFSATFKLTMIRRDDVVGEVCAMEDTKNPSWHAYLSVGESQDGITVKKIDLEARKVLLGKEGRADEWLPPDGAAASTSSRASVLSSKMSAAPGVPMPVRRLGRHVSPVNTVIARPPQPPPAPTMTPEEMEGHLQEIQKGIIRSGGEAGPALPVPLSPESDDQLVKEGFLPPPE